MSDSPQAKKSGLPSYYVAIYAFFGVSSSMGLVGLILSLFTAGLLLWCVLLLALKLLCALLLPRTKLYFPWKDCVFWILGCYAGFFFLNLQANRVMRVGDAVMQHAKEYRQTHHRWPQSLEEMDWQGPYHVWYGLVSWPKLQWTAELGGPIVWVDTRGAGRLFRIQDAKWHHGS